MPVSVVHGYVDVHELKATLSLEGQTYADDDLARAINAASRLIDTYCGQRFWVDTADVTRTFTPTTADQVDFPVPLSTLTTFKTDQDGDGVYETTWTSGTHFDLTPTDAPDDSMPWTGAARRRTATNAFPVYISGGVQVVGKWGWAAVPAQVVEACRIQASRLMVRTREAPLGVAGLSFEGGGTRLMARLDPDVQVLLEGLDVRQRVR